MISVEDNMVNMELKDSVNNEEQVPNENAFMQFGEKLEKTIRVRDNSYIIERVIGPFTTQEAAQEYKEQNKSNEQGWEVKRDIYVRKGGKEYIIWTIRLPCEEAEWIKS